MQPQQDAARFQCPWTIAIVAALGLAITLPGTIYLAATAWGLPSVGGKAFLGAFAFAVAAFAWLCGDMLRRSRNAVVADDQGLWSLPTLGATRLIAWSDVGRVKADDVGQRLVVTDRSGHAEIRIEYQIEGYEALRDFILQNTDPSTRPTTGRLFHKSKINKSIFSLGALIFAAALVGTLGQGWKPTVLLGAFLATTLVGIARDPNTLEIGTGSIVFRYPGWTKRIPFNDISEIGSDDQRTTKGNVWAAVTIVCKHGKPITLYRYLEGSLALAGALRSALEAHRAQAAKPNLSPNPTTNEGL